jgi:hypothetical protein
VQPSSCQDGLSSYFPDCDLRVNATWDTDSRLKDDVTEGQRDSPFPRNAAIALSCPYLMKPFEPRFVRDH